VVNSNQILSKKNLKSTLRMEYNHFWYPEPKSHNHVRSELIQALSSVACRRRTQCWRTANFQILWHTANFQILYSIHGSHQVKAHKICLSHTWFFLKNNKADLRPASWILIRVTLRYFFYEIQERWGYCRKCRRDGIFLEQVSLGITRKQARSG
jgi:hypothetical protein